VEARWRSTESRGVIVFVIVAVLGILGILGILGVVSVVVVVVVAAVVVVVVVVVVVTTVVVVAITEMGVVVARGVIVCKDSCPKTIDDAARSETTVRFFFAHRAGLGCG